MVATKKTRPMTKDEFKKIIKDLGRSERGAAPMIGLSVRQTQRIAWGDSKVPPLARKLLRAAKRYNMTADEIEAL